MPIKQCSNGKWRIGSGECIYDTKEKATEVWVAILAQGGYAKPKISFDYDGVLSTDKGKAKAKELSKVATIYIISARSDKEGMLSTAKELGIPSSRVFATGSNKEKVATIDRLGINTHYDNNPDVISEVRKLDNVKGLNFEMGDLG